VEHIFYEKKSLSVLLIGEMALNEELISYAKTLSKSVHLCTSEAQMKSIVSHSKIDLIFGTLFLEEASYLDTLHLIQQEGYRGDIALFLHEKSIGCLESILALQCSRYLCLKAEKIYAAKHLQEAIKAIARKNIFLKDTQYFEALLQSSVVSQSDVQGNITYVNENFMKVTGYTEEEVLGKNHRILKHPSNPLSIYQDMWSTILRGEVWRERVLNLNKDGSDFWADTLIIPFKDAHTGEILQFIAIRRDITQMLVEKRAVYAKEIKAQEQMKLSEAKDSFLILFTHELKTPLNAIINFSQYLHKNMHRIEEIPKEKRMHLLEQIYKSASSMLENVTNILDLSRLRNEKINFNYTLFDVKASIMDVIEKHEALAAEHKRTVSFQDDGSEPYISSDEYRFKQIMANIISNAIKYGHTSVEIFLLSDNEKIEVIVEDDGKGVVNKEAAFELYEQDAKGVTSMEKKGTGIGLNFVKLLCEGLHFTCCIEDSKDLGGAKFILTKFRKDV